jgi:hypothetical protein
VGRSRLIFDEAERVGRWCQSRIPNFIGWSGRYQAIGYEIDGALRGGVVYTDYTPANLVISAVLEAPLTRSFLFSIFYYPFIQCRVRHVACMVEESNLRSINICKRAGFTLEGRLREAAIGGEDVMIFGMLARECRWLRLDRGTLQ